MKTSAESQIELGAATLAHSTAPFGLCRVTWARGPQQSDHADKDFQNC